MTMNTGNGRTRPHFRPQHGAALVVGLILLLVMTVLGVSGMNTAALELLMAGNAEAQQEAFQAAETGIDIAIAQENWTTQQPTTLAPVDLGNGSSTTADTTFSGCTLVPGRAYSAGETVGVSAWHFDVVAVGTGPRDATSTHTQSFYKPGPAC